jgi:pyruvate dehydrogenase E2 component (dihydrolipoamide acetyltransferase)
MAEIVTMPKLGFDMAEGTLVRWVIQEGEKVSKGAVLAEIETDKATVEVESNFDGVVVKHLVSTGEVVPINTPIAVIGEQGEDINVDELLSQAAPVESKAAEVRPEKAEAGLAEPEESLQTQVKPEQVAAASLLEGVRASPLARRMAQDMHIDLQKVSGSGPGGRILKKDIQAYVEKRPEPEKAPAEAPKAPAPAPERPPLPPLTPLPAAPQPESERIPLERLRATIGRRMTEAKQQVPHFYVTHDYDVEALLALRKQVNQLLPDEDRISVNDFVVKAAALALHQFPNLNASLDGKDVVRHGQVNIGVAVALEGGLLTVVCRDADRKPLRQISAELRTMVARARQGKVRPEDIEGSTFSISNMGMYAVENFSAIINPPEAGILAVGSARQTPVVRDGEIVPGWRMKITLSVDHRVSDGAEGARYLQTLAAYLEEPLRLLV